MLRFTPILALVALTLAGCTPQPAEDETATAPATQQPAATPAPAPVADEPVMSSPPAAAAPAPAPAQENAMCDATKAQFAVGQTYSAALAEQARAAAGAGIVRRLVPGQMVTMEYRADRLNLDTDAAGKVTAARCG